MLGLGAATTLVGVVVLGPVRVGPAMSVLAAPAARVSGVTGRYAGGNARRAPRRTAATASALMIGVALVGFITIFAASTKASIGAALDESLRADYVVESGSWANGFAPSIEDDLAALAEVDELSPLRATPVEVDGATTELLAVDTTVIDELADLEVAAGAITDVHGDGIAVESETAAELDLELGDAVSVRFGDGAERDLAVRARFDGGLTGGDGGSWIVHLDTFEAHVADVYDRQVYVSVSDGVDAARARSAVEGAVAGWANARVHDRAEVGEAITAEIDRMLNLVYGLLALAVVIAVLGIANTMILSVHERTREIGVLRAIGMHPRQVRSALRWESFLIAVLGAALGTVLAVGGAWGTVSAFGDLGVTRLVVPVAPLLVILAGAGLAGVAAATGPARRAARLDIMAALGSA